MRKFAMGLLSFILLISAGCSTGTTNTDNHNTAYEGYYTAITENTRFQESSFYYHISTEISKLPDGTYTYCVILDEPQIAMYQVVMMVVENDVSYADSKKMMPSIGIFDQSYNLVPFQSNMSEGYASGLALNGESTVNTINLKLLVEWKDKNKEKTTREFLSLNISAENGEAG